MRCPRCDHELDGTPKKCDECKGCWVTPLEVSRTVKSHSITWAEAGESKLSCPECHATMTAITFRGVQVDRCMPHGVWFDIGEVTDMARQTGKLGPEEVAKADKPSIGSKVVDGAASVGSGILEVLATAIDIVT